MGVMVSFIYIYVQLIVRDHARLQSYFIPDSQIWRDRFWAEFVI